LAKVVLQQCRTGPRVPVQSFDADERKVPMGLDPPVMFRLLEESGDVGLLLLSDAFRNNSLRCGQRLLRHRDQEPVTQKAWMLKGRPM
jgi:hypothetical protein